MTPAVVVPPVVIGPPSSPSGTCTAPVTKQSGKQRLVAVRYACNHRLRTALFHWARVSVQHDNAASRYYAALRDRGHRQLDGGAGRGDGLVGQVADPAYGGPVDERGHVLELHRTAGERNAHPRIHRLLLRHRHRDWLSTHLGGL